MGRFNPKDELGNHIKDCYENPIKQYLRKDQPIIFRIDGIHFHKLTKDFATPFDTLFLHSMRESMLYLCKTIPECVLGYQQSDEISLMIIPYKRENPCIWHRYEVQKLVSHTASRVSIAFEKAFTKNVQAYCSNPNHPEHMKTIYRQQANTFIEFDSRVWNMPKEEVIDYFYWRQKDCIRNSIHMAARAQFNHKALEKLTSRQLQEKLYHDAHIDYEKTYTPCERRGTFCIKRDMKWILDENTPVVRGKDRSYIESLL